MNISSTLTELKPNYTKIAEEFSQRHLQRLLNKILRKEKYYQYTILNRVKLIIAEMVRERALRYNRILQRLADLKGIFEEPIVVPTLPKLSPFPPQIGRTEFHFLPHLNPDPEELEKQIYALIEEKGYEVAVAEILQSIQTIEELPSLTELEEMIQLPEVCDEKTRHLLKEKRKIQLYVVYHTRIYLLEYQRWYERMIRNILETIKRRLSKESIFYN